MVGILVMNRYFGERDLTQENFYAAYALSKLFSLATGPLAGGVLTEWKSPWGAAKAAFDANSTNTARVVNICNIII